MIRDRSGRKLIDASIVRDRIGVQAAVEFGNWVYFIQCECPNRYVKIGVATNPRSRLAHLQIGNPYKLTLLGVIGGGYELEQQIHLELAELSVGGEWFRMDPLLDAYLKVTAPWHRVVRAAKIPKDFRLDIEKDQDGDGWLVIDQKSGRLIADCGSRREAEYELKRLKGKSREYLLSSLGER